MRTGTRGAILATAVAVAFIANPVLAEDSSSSKGQQQIQPTLVACLGVNSCKGQSACKSFDHDCQAMNTCKGKGFILITENECKQKGGKVIDPDQMQRARRARTQATASDVDHNRAKSTNLDPHR